ncbi:MAG: transcription elongation factor subunit Spt4 [Candidatus Bathyarchaeota archaeon]|nr:transcription elongation factor subunit Spt4 [Candidatus Bathyarchaeota archaeon]MDP7207741.1 transcription elongation factor subunit Spt4 [Candidatus Bathyarchaeota archaeon]
MDQVRKHRISVPAERGNRVLKRACKVCKIITEDTPCPICKATDLSDDYSGLLVVLNSDGSQIAHKMGITEDGQYALKIR